MLKNYFFICFRKLTILLFLGDKMIICPNCGEQNEETSNFCKKCGLNISTENNSSYEEYAPTYGRFTRKMESKLNNNKLLDKFIDNITPGASKLHEKDCMDKNLTVNIWNCLNLHSQKFMIQQMIITLNLF